MTYRYPSLLRISLLWLFVLLASVAARAAVEENPTPQPRNRLAIVIGNSNYQSTRIEHLPNAVNDAKKLADSLRRLNFDVLLGTDLSSADFDRLFRDAEAKLPVVRSVLIFYAGHGVQLQNQNYLLPVDTPDPESLEKITAGAVKLNDVIARFSSPDRQTFLFLDACRNNPVGNAPDVSNGLAELDVGENTFVAFATQPRNVTVDGTGSNSPFTTALLGSIEIPGLSISDMMIRVRNETLRLTFNRQDPWDQSSLREQFYFTEQQVLDPAQLSASLSRILADPVAKERLQVELAASNDLQAAVLIVGQTLRGVDVPTGPAIPGIEAAGSQPAGTQVASLETARETAVSGIETLIVGGSDESGEAKATELARSIQTELRRLGCYRMTIDGDWGKGSVRALSEYYKITKQNVASTDPTAELLGDLFLRSGRICTQPEVYKKAKPAKVATSDSVSTKKSKSSSSSSKGRKTKSSSASRPAAPPPDISGGIGIGGVF